MVRSIASVVAGFLLWTVLWLSSNSLVTVLSPGSFKEDGSTDSVMILDTILLLSVVFSLLSGYVTALIKRTPSQVPVWVLGLLLLVVGIVVQVLYWALFPLWYNSLFLVFLFPAVLIGASFKKTVQ